jgi:tetratricopeptide (TPR) repeat protein
MTRNARLLVTLIGILTSSTAVPAQVPAPTNPFRDFPTADYQVLQLATRGRNAKLAARQLATAPEAPETIDMLLQRDRVDEALRAMRAALPAADAERTRAILAIASVRFSDIAMDGSRGYVDTLRTMLIPVRDRLAEWPREDAARVARALMGIDNQLERGGSAGWPARVEAFRREYTGTEAALLAEVDAIDDVRVSLPARIDALDRFWRAHPGSVAGAKALYMKGFQLAHNVALTGIEPRGSDPTPRFLQVIEILKELESGRYPPCEWVTKAPGELVVSFFVSGLIDSTGRKPVFAPGNLERMREEYENFVLTHFDPNGPEDGINSNVGYVVTSKIASLAEIQGDRVAGVEKILSALEARPANARAARLFRAQYYVSQSTGGSDAARSAMGVKARSALSALAGENAGYESRKALATLAWLEFYSRDYVKAVPVLEQYITRYPTSAWAWVAALRIGQAYEAQGKWLQAADVYRKAATTFAGEAPARVLGDAYAARALEAMGNPEESLRASRRALDAWDTDYGIEYSLAASQAPLVPRPALPVPDRTKVTREALAQRVGELERAATLPGGMTLERGRWQLSERRYEDARITLAEYLTKYPSSPSLAEARALKHRADLERALELAAIEGTNADRAAADRILDQLVKEPFDFAVGAARMARALSLLAEGLEGDARVTTRAALLEMVSGQRARQGDAPASPLDADVAAIRSEVFKPTGDLAVYRGTHWNAFDFPAEMPRFVIVNADVTVKLSTNEVVKRRIVQSFPGIENALSLTTDEIGVFDRIVTALGGTKTRQPTQVMETPNQPVGNSVNIVKLWSSLFPSRGGHWGGWVFETYPIVSRIEFLDAARTKASAFVTIGYSGATVVLEKVDGKWKAIRLTNQWIT